MLVLGNVPDLDNLWDSRDRRPIQMIDDDALLNGLLSVKEQVADHGEKGTDLTQSYDKLSLHPQENPKSNVATQKKATKNFVYTTIAD